jgi:hypothetical protein
VVVVPTIPVGGDEGQVDAIAYNYAVTLTQECDLEHDFHNRQGTPEKHDKFLPSVLLAPAYLAERLREGEHLSDIGLVMERYNSSRWRLIKRNGNERYHFLAQDITFQVPDLVIDFKHYFTMPRDNFYSELLDREHYVASVRVPFREHLSSRFTHYLARIGLPE